MRINLCLKKDWKCEGGGVEQVTRGRCFEAATEVLNLRGR